MLRNLQENRHSRQGRPGPSSRALRHGRVTIDELLNSVVWMLRNSPAELAAVLRRRELFCRDLLDELKSATNGREEAA